MFLLANQSLRNNRFSNELTPKIETQGVGMADATTVEYIYVIDYSAGGRLFTNARTLEPTTYVDIQRIMTDILLYRSIRIFSIARQNALSVNSKGHVLS